MRDSLLCPELTTVLNSLRIVLMSLVTCSASSRRPALATSLLLGLVASALTGCSAFSDDGGGSGSSPRVVAAFYPLEFLAERVAGDHAEVQALTRPGKEPHDLELTIKETALISDGSLVVYEKDFQPAVDAAIDQNAEGEVLDVSAAADLVPIEDHAGEERAEDGEEHAEEGEEGHDPGDLDPHFWLDPVRMADVADAVADSLAEVDPDNADDYAANAEDLRSDLEELDAAYTSGLADCDRNTIVVSHDAFGYLSRYGLEVAPIAGLSPDAEPTPADIAELQELIEDDGVTTVFSERLAPPELTETLAEDAGVKTAVLDPIEGLTDDTAEEDYLSLMEQNLEALERANGCR
jgi:zinc transport system substrate-binding protein